MNTIILNLEQPKTLQRQENSNHFKSTPKLLKKNEYIEEDENDEEEQEETQEFIYCEKRDEGFFMPTKYGYITSTTPWPADENILLEIDEMIQSLQER